MRVLVTGSTGFIGRHVVSELVAQGHEAIGLARSTTPAWKVSHTQALGARMVFGDILDVESLVQPMKDCDAVVHAAAYVAFGDVDPKQMERINVTGTENVLAIARDLDVRRTLHVSSIAALGLHDDIEADETHEHPGQYGSPYERTKHLASLVAEDHARRGLHVVQALPAVVFGIRDPNFGIFFKRWMRRKVPVLPGPETIVSLVHVEDLARGLVAALLKGRRGEKFLFTQRNISLGELFGAIETASGVGGPRIKVPSGLVRAAVRTAGTLARPTPWRHKIRPTSADLIGRTRRYSAATAIQRLGWEPGDFDARLAETARWYAHWYAEGRPGPPAIGADGQDPAKSYLDSLRAKRGPDTAAQTATQASS